MPDTVVEGGNESYRHTVRLLGIQGRYLYGAIPRDIALECVVGEHAGDYIAVVEGAIPTPDGGIIAGR